MLVFGQARKSCGAGGLCLLVESGERWVGLTLSGMKEDCVSSSRARDAWRGAEQEGETREENRHGIGDANGFSTQRPEL